jgi:hypothetical protein
VCDGANQENIIQIQPGLGQVISGIIFDHSNL